MRTIAGLVIGLSLILLSGCGNEGGNSGSVLKPAFSTFRTRQGLTSPVSAPVNVSPTILDSRRNGSDRVRPTRSINSSCAGILV